MNLIPKIVITTTIKGTTVAMLANINVWTSEKPDIERILMFSLMLKLIAAAELCFLFFSIVEFYSSLKDYN